MIGSNRSQPPGGRRAAVLHVSSLMVLLAAAPGCGDGDSKGKGIAAASGGSAGNNSGAGGSAGSTGNPFAGGSSGSAGSAGNGGAIGPGGSGPAQAGRGGSVGAGTGGSTGDGGAPSGPSVGKFCNTLMNADGSLFEQTLEIGNPPIKLTAQSGKCSTSVGQMCVALPTGRVVLALVEGGMTVATGAFEILPGTRYLFVTTVNPMTMQEGLTGGALRPEFTCENANPFENVGQADGGAPPPLPPPPRAMLTPATTVFTPLPKFHAPHRYLGLERNATR